MPFLGIHGSISGGFARAVDEAADLGCRALQIFTRNQLQWKSKPLDSREAAEFRQARQERGILRAFAHAGYLINIASSDAALFSKSVAGLVEEHRRAELLGLEYLVLHPGSPGARGAALGIESAKRGLREALGAGRGFRCRILLETAAGQGHTVGRTFQELAEMLGESEKLGVCLDTCHVFAAGYDLSQSQGYEKLLQEFDAAMGLERLCALHLNDSVRGLGSRVDRHEHIGRGNIGLGAFRRILGDPRLAHLPMVLETPKRKGADSMNLEVLRRLAPGLKKMKRSDTIKLSPRGVPEEKEVR